MDSRETEHSTTSRWLTDLRREFVRVASKRVDADDVDDVVQDAMRVVAEKGIDRGSDAVSGLPALAWCMQVLRNTIGNHYQRQATRRRWTELDGVAGERAGQSMPLEALSSQATLELIESALREIKASSARCADYLSRLADGVRAGDIADDESVERTAFYRRLYRCRQKLRELLVARGVMV